MRPIRCDGCNKLLLEVKDGQLVIACPRCGMHQIVEIAALLHDLERFITQVKALCDEDGVGVQRLVGSGSSEDDGEVKPRIFG